MILIIVNSYWVRLSTIWRIIDIKEGESALADNTFWDLHNFSDDLKAEFNNELFNCSFKILPCLNPSLNMLTSIDVKFIFNYLFGVKGLFSTANILQIADGVRWIVFLLFLLCFWAIVCLFLSLETRGMFCHFVLTTKITLPHPQVFLIALLSFLAIMLHNKLTSFFIHCKILPNMVNSSWLWWITCGIWANQKQGNILNE